MVFLHQCVDKPFCCQILSLWREVMGRGKPEDTICMWMTATVALLLPESKTKFVHYMDSLYLVCSGSQAHVLLPCVNDGARYEARMTLHVSLPSTWTTTAAEQLAGDNYKEFFCSSPPPENLDSVRVAVRDYVMHHHGNCMAYKGMMTVWLSCIAQWQNTGSWSQVSWDLIFVS